MAWALPVFILLSACEGDLTPIDFNTGSNRDLAAAELVDTFTLKAVSVLGTGNLSSENAALLVGQANDDRTGPLRAEAYFEVRLPQVNAAPPRLAADGDPELLITFPFTKLQFDSTGNSRIRFILYQLKTKYSSDSIYFTNQKREYDATQVVSDTVIESLAVVPDSARQLKLRIKNGPFLQSLMAYLTQYGYDNNVARFRETFPGFALVAEAVPGTLVNVNLTDGASARLFYNAYRRVPVGQIVQRDTLVREAVTFSILPTNNTRFHYYIEGNLAGTPILQENIRVEDTLTPTGPNGRVYVRGGLPIWARVRFPGLSDFFEKEKQISIIRAELLVINDEPTATRAPESLLAWQGIPSKIALQRNQFNSGAIRNEDLGNAGLNYFYEQERRAYPVNITGYVQDIAAGLEPNTGITLSVPVSDRSLRTLSFSTARGVPAQTKLRLYFVRLNGLN